LDVLRELNLPIDPAPPGYRVLGIGGGSGCVLVTTEIRFARTDGIEATVKGQYSAFQQPTITDYSVLGRDVLGNFDVILSWQRQEVLLLAGNHQYQIISP
jgi:hypothetical protein